MWVWTETTENCSTFSAPNQTSFRGVVGHVFEDTNDSLYTVLSSPGLLTKINIQLQYRKQGKEKN